MATRMMAIAVYAASSLSLVLLPPSVSAQEKGDTTKSFIEIRLARQTAAPGFQQVADPVSERIVYVSNESTFNDEDIEHVGSRKMPNGLALRVRWAPDAAERLTGIMRGEVGTGSDFLAIFINGELVNTVRIRVDPEATVTGSVAVAVPVSSERAISIAEAVAVRWPGGGGY